MVIGLAGTILPVLPGTILIFLGALLFVLFFGFEKVSVGIIIAIGVIVLLSILFDFLAGSIGARKFGASKAGVIGAILGAIVGLFVGNIFGLILGPLIGAVLGEVILGKNLKVAGKAGVGTLVGFLGGAIMKFVFGLLMILLFVFALMF